MSKEARLFSAMLIIAACLCTGASYRTENFIVTADTPGLAKEIGDKAESDRRQLAVEWLGQELPPWSDKCPIAAQVGPHLGAGGATSFMFSHSRPFGWTMSIQGSRERVLDSVLPHEVTHTIFATHFGRPLPRWADEGACTTVEHDSEKLKQHRLLIQFLTTNRGIAFNRMFAMTEYPPDVLPLYSQGFSLARYLIAQGGKRKFVDYVGEGMQTENWSEVTNKYYGFQNLSDLQVTWLDWVRQGSPRIDGPQRTEDSSVILVSNQEPQPTADNTASLAAQANVTAVDQSESTPTSSPASSPASSPNNTTGVVPVKDRPVMQLASNVTRRSWYLEQRDLARGQSPATDDHFSTAVLSKGGGYAPGSIGGSRPRATTSTSATSTLTPTTSTPTPTTLTRPQPIGYPEQTIIQMHHLSDPAPDARLPVTPTRFQQPRHNFNSTSLPLSTGGS